MGIGYQRYALDYRSLDNGYCVSSYPGFLFICPDDRPNNSLGLAVGIPGYLSLTLHEWGRLGRKAFGDVATAALPDTILGWYREAPRALDGSKYRGPGRPRVDRAIEELIVLMAEENRSWGYDRIVGVLANLEFEVSDQTV